MSTFLALPDVQLSWACIAVVVVCFGTVLKGVLLLCVISGISLKTQELYALVFATRYLDIFTTYISLYNTVMKLIFLGTSFSIVWYMRYHKTVRLSYDKNNDTFRHYFLILPCFLLALVLNNKFTFREVCL
jgi:ER lumen protein retaining receptor